MQKQHEPTCKNSVEGDGRWSFYILRPMVKSKTRALLNPLPCLMLLSYTNSLDSRNPVHVGGISTVHPYSK